MPVTSPSTRLVSRPCLALAIFAANLGLSIIFPLIPHLAGLGSGGERAVGWIFASYAAFAVVGQVLGGVLADRFDEGMILRRGLWLYFLSLLAFTLAEGLPALLLVRAIEGFAIGLVVPCVMKLVVDHAPVERRGRDIGFVMGLGGLGFIIGPPLGSSLARFGFVLPFLAPALIAGLAAIAVSRGVGPRPVVVASGSFQGAVRGEWAELGHLLARPAFLGLVLPLFALKANFASLQALLPIFGSRVLGADLGSVAWLFVVTAVAYGLVQPLAGRLSDRFATRGLIAVSFLLMVGLLMLMAVQTSYWRFLPMHAAFSLCQTAGVLFAMKHLADGIGEGTRGRSFGLASALGDVGMIVAPPLLVPLFAWHAEAPLVGLAGVMAMTLVAFWLAAPGHRVPPTPGEPGADTERPAAA